MSALTSTAGGLGVRATARASRYRIELLSDWRQAAARWGAFDPSTPFQHPHWYEAWYDAFAATAGVTPLIAVISDAATSERAMLLPLIRRSENGIRTIEFADLSLTDFNAPV